MKYLVPIVPALVAFGPLFMVMGLSQAGFLWLAYLGALTTGFGLLLTFVIAVRGIGPRSE